MSTTTWDLERRTAQVRRLGRLNLALHHDQYVLLDEPHGRPNPKTETHLAGRNVARVVPLSAWRTSGVVDRVSS
jgi:hypothetical protein